MAGEPNRASSLLKRIVLSPLLGSGAAGGHRFVVPLLLAGVSLAAYLPSFGVPFQFDDLPIIVNNPDVHVTELDAGALLRAAWSFEGRAVVFLTFALNHLAGGLDVFGYHLVNWVVHAVNGLLVYAVAGRILGVLSPGSPEALTRRASLLAALLFVAHPVQTQAVTYVVQRCASLGAFFAFLAVLAYLRARADGSRRAFWCVACGVAWLAAWQSKENHVVLPLFLLLVEVLAERELVRRLRRHAAMAIAVTLAMGAVAGLSLVLYRTSIATQLATQDVSAGARLFTEARVVFLYLSLVLFPLPSRLRVDYDFPPSSGLLEPPATLLAVVGLAALVALAIRLARPRPLVTLAIGWFLGNLVVESLIPRDLVFEHRLYFPLFGPFLLASWALVRGAERLRVAVFWVAAPLVGVLAFLAHERNEMWTHPTLLYEQVVSDSPNLARAQLTLGVKRRDAGDLEGAAAALRKAAELDPRSGSALVNLAELERRRGNLAQAERLARDALRVDPGGALAADTLARVLLDGGRPEEAESLLEALVRAHPGFANAWVNLGVLRARRGDAEAAGRMFDRAILADAGSASAYLNRGALRLSRGRAAEALDDLEQAEALAPGRPEVPPILASALEALGRRDEAIRRLSKLAADAPTRRFVHHAIGNLQAGAGDFQAAEESYRRELALGRHSASFNNLGNIHALRGDLPGARSLYREAVEADPQNADARTNLLGVEDSLGPGGP